MTSALYPKKKLIKYYEKIKNVKSRVSYKAPKEIYWNNSKKQYNEKNRLAEIEHSNRLFVRKIDDLNSREGDYNPYKLNRESLRMPTGTLASKTFRRLKEEKDLETDQQVK